MGPMMRRRRRARRLALLAVGFVAGGLFGLSAGPRLPACAEDEAVWWVAPDVRECVHVERIAEWVLERRRAAAELELEGGA